LKKPIIPAAMAENNIEAKIAKKNGQLAWSTEKEVYAPKQ
jgi:hypothetical protein